MEAVAVFLKALGYPEVARFEVPTGQAPLDHRSIQSLIIWLENQKIRHYAVADRQALTAPEPERWEAAYTQYLADLGCPTGPADQERSLEWICSKSVSLEYTDHKDRLNAASEAAIAAAGPVADWSELSLPPFRDIADPAVAEAVRRMHRLVQADDDASERPLTAAALEELGAVIRGQVLPALPEDGEARQPPSAGGNGAQRAPAAAARTAQQQQQSSSSTTDPLTLLSRFPLGFSTGDGAQDAAATILRLLYLRDLRELQSQADEALEALQARTARVMAEATFGRPK